MEVLREVTANADAPIPLSYILFWCVLSGSVGIVFTVLRPLASRRIGAETNTVSSPEKGSACTAEASEGRLSLRAVAQTVFSVLGCGVFDLLHRSSCLLWCSPRLLARRGLLPLGHTFWRDGLWTRWVNTARHYWFCDEQVMRWLGRDTVCLDWQLPVAGVLDGGAIAEIEMWKVSQPSTAVERGHYHRATWCALGLIWVVVIGLYSQWLWVLQLYSNSRVNTELETSGESERRTISSSETNEPEKASFLFHKTSVQATEAPGDDAWVDSAEALAEEERLAAMVSAGQSMQEGSHAPSNQSRGSSSSTTTIILRDCWPILACCSYAAAFAYMGGLSIFMRLIFPVGVVMSSIGVLLHAV